MGNIGFRWSVMLPHLFIAWSRNISLESQTEATLNFVWIFFLREPFISHIPRPLWPWLELVLNSCWIHYSVFPEGSPKTLISSLLILILKALSAQKRKKCPCGVWWTRRSPLGTWYKRDMWSSREGRQCVRTVKNWLYMCSWTAPSISSMEYVQKCYRRNLCVATGGFGGCLEGLTV